MYNNYWKSIMDEAHDAFCLSVGLASVEAKHKNSNKFAKRVCYAHDVLQKIEQAALDDKFENTVVKINHHLFSRLFKKLMNS